MVLCVNNFCKSGFGDRMIDLFIFSIYSKLLNDEIYINWTPFQDYSLQYFPQWRYLDTIRTNFLSFFKLPTSIVLKDTPTESENTFDTYLGGLTSPYVFYEKHLHSALPYEFYNSIVEATKKEFGIQVPEFAFSEPYIVLHLRRTDKLRGVCETQINRNPEDTLENLDKKTKERILEAKEKGYKYFFIASDSQETKEEYKQFIESHHLHVLQPPNIYNLIESYYDTWVMKQSNLIMVSTKYSTYSLSCALIYDIPLLNVLTEEVYRKYKYEHHIKLVQEVPLLKTT
jgi:hypothetical protein